MTRLELLTVLKSLDLAMEKGTKEDVQKLLKELIRDAESDKRQLFCMGLQLSWLERTPDKREVGGSSPPKPRPVDVSW